MASRYNRYTTDSLFDNDELGPREWTYRQRRRKSKPSAPGLQEQLVSESYEFETSNGRKYTLARDLAEFGYVSRNGEYHTSGEAPWAIYREDGTRYSRFDEYQVRGRSFCDNDGVYYIIKGLRTSSSYGEEIEPAVALAMIEKLGSENTFAVGTEEHAYLAELNSALFTYRSRVNEAERIRRRLKNPGEAITYQREARNVEWARARLEDLGLSTTAIEMAVELQGAGMSPREIHEALQVLVD